MDNAVLETVVDEWEELIETEESDIPTSQDYPLNIEHSGELNIYYQNENTSEAETEETLEEYVEGLKTDSILRAASVPEAMNSENLQDAWILSYNGNEIKVLFPLENELKIIDDKIVNLSNNNITGCVISDSGIDVSTYFTDTVTIMSLTASGSQNNAYRYGAHGYITRYSPGTGNTLITNVSYTDFEVVQRPKIGSGWGADSVVIVALLFLSFLVSIIGAFFRRD